MLFSIILPTYNRANFISRAIKSVLSQTYLNWELIIVDDGSADNTKEVVAKYKDNRIKYIWQKNQERCIARNNGIELAQGDFICFLDSDDYMLPNHLEEFKKTIEEHNFKEAVYYCNTKCEHLGKIEDITETHIKSRNTVEFVFANVIGVPRVCVPKSVFKKYKFNPNQHIGEDRELWFRIAHEYEFIGSGKYTTVYIEHSERSISMNSPAPFFASYNLTRKLIANDKSGKLHYRIKKSTLSNALFNIAKYFIFHNRRLKAMFYLLKSIINNTRSTQIVHRILLMLACARLYKQSILKEYMDKQEITPARADL